MPILLSLSDRQKANVSAVDSKNAETVQIAPMLRDRVDPSRGAVEISAVLRVGGGDETNLQGGFAQNWQARIAVGKAELHIDRSAYPSLKVIGGDKVRAMSRPGQPWFEVLRVDDRGDTRLVLALGEV